MKYPQNIKNRIILVAVAVLTYIFVPVLIGLPLFSLFSPVVFPIAGHFVHAMQILIPVILLYGALEWVKPSLIPRFISKKIIVGIICAIVIVGSIPSVGFSLESVGTCTITQDSQGVLSTSSNSRSTEQECIDSCIEGDDARYNQKSCEFVSAETSWSRTPEELKGYKPRI